MVNYILDKERTLKSLSVTVRLPRQGHDSHELEAQSMVETRYKASRTHSEGFKEDEHRLTDCAMAGIALEYLEENGTTGHANSHCAPLRQGEHPHGT